jgi:hypothetical protein
MLRQKGYFVVLALTLIQLIQPLLLTPGTVYAGEGRGIAVKTADDFLHIASSPLRWKGRDALVAGGALGGVMLIYSKDDAIRGYFQRRRDPGLRGIADVGEAIGSLPYDAGFLALCWTGGHVLRDDRMKEAALLSTEAFIIANAIGVAAKVALGRARPYTSEGHADFTPFSFDTDRTSLPSSHAISAFSIATVFAEEYENPIVDISAYSLSTLTAIERVYDDRHWASDVALGALIGTVVGKAVARLNKERARDAYIIPFFGGLGHGVGVMAVRLL